MSEFLVIQVGQCGNQIGGLLWPSILQEYRISPSQSHKKPRKCSRPAKDEDLEFTFNSFLHNTTENVTKNLGVLNLSDLKTNKVKARVICIDMEDSVVSRFQKSDLSFLFDKSAIIKSYSGSGNNWAEGYYTHGFTFKNKIMKIVTKYVERCDSLHGILLVYSMGGGTGSGLGSFILEQLEDHFPSIERFVTCVYPNGSEDVITAPYNAMLATQHLIRHATCVFPVENRALQEVCDRKRLSGSQAAEGCGSIAGTFGDMNSIVAKLLLHVTRTAEFRHERDQYEYGAVPADEIFVLRLQPDRNLRCLWCFKAHVHHYTKVPGFEFDSFYECQNTIADIIDSYEEVSESNCATEERILPNISY